MKCPTHGIPMICSPTQFGQRWQCSEPGCTIACWGGRTSTPADYETRQLRNECHREFDPLWKQQTRWTDRRTAYLWLQRIMGLDADAGHIGMFDADQCRK